MPRHGTPINKKIGQRIMLARRAKGLTQKALAKEAGTSFAVISRLETGSQSVFAERLAAIARVLGLSLDELCREDDGGEINPADAA
jgi:transcriptional regulator with XRE-family HTH domain